MKTSVLLMITGFVYGLFGLGFIFIPDNIIGMYGGDIGSIGAFTTELYGAMLLGSAVICWQAREAEEDDERGIAFKAILLGMCVAITVSAILLTVNQLTSPTAKAWTWMLIVIQGLFAYSFFYARFGPYKKPQAEE